MLGIMATRALHTVLGVTPRAKLETSFFAPTGRKTAQVVGYRSVDLTGVSERLANVKAYTPYSALVSSENGNSAVLGALDPGAIVSLEVRSYVETLVYRGQIDFGQPATPAAGKIAAKVAKKAKKAAAKKAGGKKVKARKVKAKKPAGKRATARKVKRRGAGFVARQGQGQPTHILKRVGNEVVLERVSFACGCTPARFRCVSA
jgi:hypothetical protein